MMECVLEREDLIGRTARGTAGGPSAAGGDAAPGAGTGRPRRRRFGGGAAPTGTTSGQRGGEFPFPTSPGT